MSRIVRRLCVVGLMGSVLFASIEAQAQATYSWSTNTSGNWSTGAWSPAGNPGASDTANIENIATSGAVPTITYDAGASGTVGTLNFFNSAPTGFSPTITLLLQQDLHIATAATLYMNSSTGASTGAVTINTNGHNLVVDSGATFTFGSTASNLSTFANINGTGALLVNGTFTATSALVATWSDPIAAATTFGNGSTLNIDSENTGGTRMTFGGNFTTTGNVSINATGADKIASSIYFTGANVNIGSGTTFSGFGAQAATGGPLVFDTISANPNQAITLGVFMPIGIRNSYIGTQAAPVTTVATVSATATSGATSNAIGTIFWTNSSNYSTSTLKLGSNLNVLQSGALSIASNIGTSAIGVNLALDLNGFTLDTSQSGAASRFGINTNFANGDMAFIKNSGPSSVAAGQGIFRALGFNFAVSTSGPVGDTAIGAGVILQATGSGIVNDLGVADAASLNGAAANGTVPAIAAALIDPTSIFYYAGVGSVSLQSTNARQIGQLMAGDVAGSAGGTSTISLLSDIVAQGVTTMNAGGVLDINGKNYTTTGISGSGQVKNSSAATAPASLTINATGTNTFSGSLFNVNPAQPLSVTIAAGSTGTQIFSGSATYAGTTTVNGGTLLLTGVYSGGAVAVNGGRLGGAGGSIGNSVTVNAGGGLSVSGRGTVAAGTMTVSGTGNFLDLSAALTQSSELSFLLGSNSGTSDMVLISSATGQLKIGGGLLSLADFDLSAGSTFGAGTYILFDTRSTSGINGGLAAAGLTGTLDGFGITLSQSVDVSGFQDIILTATAVPEPSPALLLPLAGGAALLFRRRRAAVPLS